MPLQQEDIILYKSLFKGRDDVYAVRWERDGKNGYMPAYDVDWTNYEKHKLQGGTFSNYKDKKLLPYSDSAIKVHLEGKAIHGIYPLLEDNTSYFIAVDFDKTNWDKSILKLHEACKKHEIQSYIEKSRSGNGGHLWIFFEESFPAIQSRKIMFELLRQANIISHFEKEPSFDRIFPNQNYHSGKGMGNLIALPLQGNSVQNGNSCFLYSETMQPYENQWEFLHKVQKISEQSLKLLYKTFFTENPQEIMTSRFNPNSKVALEIRISNQIYLKRIQLSRKLIAFLRDQLNFYNSDYLVKKNLGKSTFKTEKYFNLIEESDEEVMIPRGFTSTLLQFCKEEYIPFKIIDQRQKKKYGMTEKGCFIRIGTASEPMPQKMIDELFAKRIRNSLGRIISNKQDLKFEQLKIYYESAGMKLNEHFASNLEFLTDGDRYNYVAYLLADNNSTSIKVAKYRSKTRVDLTENNEYGNGCLIRAAKQVIDKVELENPTATQITSKERINIRLWDSIALREAIINAFVHNDFTGEVPPKFEIFPDRIEITSAGGLPDGLSQEEFFRGYSVPRNKELMRVFKDLGMVEQLRSGVPRILESYGKECFTFSDHFLRMVFPSLSGQVGSQVSLLTERQKEVLDLIIKDPTISRNTLSKRLNINPSAIQKHIDALKQKGIISRESETTGFWEIHLNE